MPSAKPSKFSGGGLLRGEDGTIVGLEFTDKFAGKDFVPGKDPKTKKERFHSLNAVVNILVDGATEPLERTLFVGSADDYTFEGATITGEKPLGKSSAWYILLESLVAAGFPEESFPDDPLTADYSAILGARCRFNWRTNEKITKKYGQVVSKKDPNKKYDREDLIVEAYYGQAEVEAPAKSAKTAAPEIDVPALGAKTVVDALAAAKGNKLTKSKLSVKILTLLSNTDADVRGDVREWAFVDENLAGIDGVNYDVASQTLTLED